MDVLAQLDRARRAVNVLEHPFYVRWTAGELSRGELCRYAREYRHAVLALAHASTLAAQSARGPQRASLRCHAAEERAHVAMWDRFARATGVSDPATPTGAPFAQSLDCARSWVAGESLLEHLAVLYAIEAGQPDVSRTKLQGLVEHYGFTAEGPATEYFRVHERTDVEHAAQARELIATLMDSSADPDGDGERLLRRAEGALRGNWLLLDGVQAAGA